jgi:dihydroorotate dehydrogenase (fumarate)
MADLRTTYLGIPLKNPIIVGASNMVNNIDNLKRMEDAGAAAIVYKSLFEEQIQLERLEMDEDMTEYNERHAEMTTLFPDIEHAGPSEHLMNLRMAKEKVSIPVIASLNCIFPDTWIEYAKLIEQTGVDAIELNFYYVPRDFTTSSKEIIDQQLNILKIVKENIKIPVSVKLSAFYANPLSAIKQMELQGASGFVLFNRFLQPDIHIDRQAHVNHFTPSNPEENKLPLRFAGLLYGNISASICCNSGIHNADDVIKMILAGADCVQVVSALYKNKIEHISIILAVLEKWMEHKNYNSLNDFKGLLSANKVNDPFIYKRAQYIDILLKSGEIFKKYKLH